MLYRGDDFKRIYHDVLFAKKNEIHPKWRSFINHQSSELLIAEIKSKNLAKNNIESIHLTMKNDSTSITLNAEVHQPDTLSFQLLKNGWKYARSKTFLKLPLKQIVCLQHFPVKGVMPVWQVFAVIYQIAKFT